jgi:hypothetical protein
MVEVNGYMVEACDPFLADMTLPARSIHEPFLQNSGGPLGCNNNLLYFFTKL